MNNLVKVFCPVCRKNWVFNIEQKMAYLENKSCKWWGVEPTSKMRATCPHCLCEIYSDKNKWHREFMSRQSMTSRQREKLH